MRKIGIFFGIFTIFGLVLFALNSKQVFDPQTEIISPVGESININTLGAKDEQRNYTVYGYLPYWTISEITNLKLDLLTDISYFGLEIDSQGNFIKTKITTPNSDEDSDKDSNNQNKPRIEEISHPGFWAWENDENLKKLLIKSKNMGIGTSFSVISHTDNVSTEFLNCNPCWENFYSNLKEEMTSRGMKDINLNFEYYELVDEQTSLKFTEFVKFLKRKMRKDFPEGEIVVTAMADSIINNRLTDIPSLAKVADKIFIMAYDFHIKPNANAGPVSPVGGGRGQSGYNIKTMIKDYLSYVPPQKLILGVPYYGFNWGESTENPSETDLSLTQTYAQIMEKAEKDEINILWDENSQVPYFEYNDESEKTTRKVYFENSESLRVKYRLAKEFNLAGIGIWALGYDEGRPELWEIIKEEFFSTTSMVGSPRLERGTFAM